MAPLPKDISRTCDCYLTKKDFSDEIKALKREHYLSSSKWTSESNHVFILMRENILTDRKEDNMTRQIEIAVM